MKQANSVLRVINTTDIFITISNVLGRKYEKIKLSIEIIRLQRLLTNLKPNNAWWPQKITITLTKKDLGKQRRSELTPQKLKNFN